MAVALRLANPLELVEADCEALLKLAPLPGAVNVTLPPDPTGSEPDAVTVTARLVPNA